MTGASARIVRAAPLTFPGTFYQSRRKSAASRCRFDALELMDEGIIEFLPIYRVASVAMAVGAQRDDVGGMVWPAGGMCPVTCAPHDCPRIGSEEERSAILLSEMAPLSDTRVVMRSYDIQKGSAPASLNSQVAKGTR